MRARQFAAALLTLALAGAAQWSFRTSRPGPGIAAALACLVAAALWGRIFRRTGEREPGAGDPVPLSLWRALRPQAGPAALAAVCVAVLGRLSFDALFTRRRPGEPPPDDVWTDLGSGLWMGAIVLAFAVGFALDRASRSRRPQPPRAPFRFWEPVALAAVFAAALAFRLHDIAHMPAYIHTDQVGFMEECHDVLEGRLRFPAAHSVYHVDLPAGTHFFVFPAFRWISDNVLAMRIPMAIAGALAVFPVWGLARMLFSPAAGIAAAAVYATAFTQVLMARWGYDWPMIPLLQGFTVYFLLRGLLRGEMLSFALCGFSLGISQYIYQALRGSLVVVALVVSVMILFRRRATLAAWPGLLFLGVAFYVTMAPYLHKPGFTWLGPRFEQTSIWGEEPGGAKLAVLAERVGRNLAANLGSFHGRGYTDSRVTYLDRPNLELLPGLFLLVGAGLALGGAARQLRYAVLWAAFAGALSPALITGSSADSFDANPRNLGTFVAACVLTGHAMDRATGAFAGAVWRRLPSVVLLFPLLGAVAAAEWRVQFRQYGAIARGPHPGNVYTAVVERLRPAVDRCDFFFGPDLATPIELAGIARGRVPYTWLRDDLSPLDARAPGRRRPAAIVVPEHDSAETRKLTSAIRERFPAARVEEIPFDNTIHVAFRVYWTGG